MTDQQTPNPTEPTQEGEKKHFTEQVEVAGNQLVDRVKALVEEGNVRRIRIINPEGNVMMEIPLTIGVAGGAALLWLTPLLAAIGAIAALVARVTIEIVREVPTDKTKHDNDNLPPTVS